jgi:MHS family proline/betaine transporter-like MFS transporter
MRSEIKKVLFSGMIGNALEWYDFILFIQFAPFIGKFFFPPEDPSATQLAVFSVFAVGFFMRPAGGLLFGYLGDKFGRKSALVFSILLMSIPTAMIGFLPTYSDIGIWSAIMLTLIRLLQGLALGGGFSGCMTFLVEHAEKDQRGLIGSASMFSLGAGVLLGILVTFACSHYLGKESFESWGWRIPFAISLFIGMIAFYIKAYVSESPVYELAKKHGHISSQPLTDMIKNDLHLLWKATAIYLTVTVPFYTFTGFFSNFLQQTMSFSMKDAITINGIAIVFFMAVMPISGRLSDIFGRKKVLICSAVSIGFLAYPCIYLLNTGDYINSLIAEILFGMALGCYMAPVPATLVELFPTSIRFSGLALSYNISAAMFGGTAMVVYKQLIKLTGSNFIPAYYVVAFVLITLISIYNYKDKYKEVLTE